MLGGRGRSGFVEEIARDMGSTFTSVLGYHCADTQTGALRPGVNATYSRHNHGLHLVQGEGGGEREAHQLHPSHRLQARGQATRRKEGVLR